MEWIEVNGRTVTEARERALDLLGVHESELEIEVLFEGKTGFLGMGRADSRIRARVKPVSREKPQDRRRRKSRDSRDGKGRRESSSTGSGGEGKSSGNGSSRSSSTRPPRESRPASTGGDETESSTAAGGSGPARSGSSRRRRSRGGANRSGSGSGRADAATESSEHDAADTAVGAAGAGSADAGAKAAAAASARSATPKVSEAVKSRDSVQKETAMAEISTQEQAEVARELLEGLLDIMELDGDVVVQVTDEDVIEAAVAGEELGLLVGAKGQTLSALEELARAAVSHAAGGYGARLHLDVADYRSRRRAALAAFTERLAAEVKETGRAKSLEPMSAADRKVVHDTATAIDGVRTSSAGEDPRRYVVISPAED